MPVTTRMNPDTGRFEEVAADPGQGKIKPPPPAAGSVTQQDVDFVNAGAEPPPLPDAQPGATPPPLPPQAPPVQPPPLPSAPQESPSGAGAAVSGATSGAAFGVAGAAVGAAAGFVAGNAFGTSPIGSLEGGGRMGGGDKDVARQTLEVMRGIARVGTPVKDAVSTNPVGSRM